MLSALGSLLARGNYTFRVLSYTATVESIQADARHLTRTELRLQCTRVSGDWPSKHWPCEFRIVAAPIPDYDRTAEGQLLLGVVRHAPSADAEVWLVAQEVAAAPLLAVLMKGSEDVFLRVETRDKVEEWDGSSFVPVLSFSLVRNTSISAAET